MIFLKIIKKHGELPEKKKISPQLMLFYEKNQHVTHDLLIKSGKVFFYN